MKLVTLRTASGPRAGRVEGNEVIELDYHGVARSNPVVLPDVSNKVDWEVELAVVVGHAVRHADEEAASEAIAGFTILWR